MGVMSCSRNYCTGIMCDTHIDSIGYICSDCQEEFKEYLIHTSKEIKTDTQILSALEEFIKTRKDIYKKGNVITVEEFFKNYTK